MPYTVDNPPEEISDLPKHAQEIWVNAFNNAYEQYEDEERAFQTAWAAVKRAYKKEDGKWVKKMVVPSDVSELMEPGRVVDIPGKVVEEPYGKKVWEGDKTALISTKHFTKYVGRPVYLIENQKAMGIIEMNKGHKIDLEEFKDLRSEHQISEEDRKDWWSDQDEFYFYPIELISKFDPPKDIDKSEKARSWTSTVTFKSLDYNNPKNYSDEELRNGYKKVNALWDNVGKPKEDLLNYHLILAEEIKNRGLANVDYNINS